MNNMYTNHMADNHMAMNYDPAQHMSAMYDPAQYQDMGNDPSAYMLSGSGNDLFTGGSNLMDALLGGNTSSNLSNQIPGQNFSPQTIMADGISTNHGDPTIDIGTGNPDNEMYETGDTPQSDPLGGDSEGWNPDDEYDPPVDNDFEWPDFEWPDFDIPDWDVPGIPDQDFEFEDFPNEAPDFPEFEKAKRKKIPMGFYDAGSAAAGFSPGDLNVNPEEFLAAQVAQEAGVTHPLQQALLGR